MNKQAKPENLKLAIRRMRNSLRTSVSTGATMPPQCGACTKLTVIKPTLTAG